MASRPKLLMLMYGTTFVLAFLVCVADGAKAQRSPKVELIPRFGHAASITSVAFSPDGARVLSGSYDRTFKLWDVTTGALLRTFQGHSGHVSSVAFSPEGARVLTGSGDHTLKLWDAMTGALLRTFEGHKSDVVSVSFSPDGRQVLSGSSDKSIKVWDAATGLLLRSIEGHAGVIYSVALSSDGKHLLSGSSDKTLKIWDAATGALLRTLETPNYVNSVAFSPDGTRVLSGCVGEETLKLWDTATGALLRTFKGGSGAFSLDGTRVLSGISNADSTATDRTLKLWDVTTGTLLRTFQGHSGSVSSVAFSPKGLLILTGSSDYTIKLWNVATGQIVRNFGNAAAVPSVVFSPNGALVLSGSLDKTVKLWDAATGQFLRSFRAPGMVSKVTFSPDGASVFAGSGVSESEYKISTTGAQLWDTRTGQLLRTVAHGEAVLAVAFSPDGTRIATGALNKNSKLWDATTGKLLRAFKEDSGWANSMAFSPTGTHLLTGGPLRLWETETGRLLRTFEVEGDLGEIHSVAFSPDGTRVLSGSDSSVRLWEAATGRLLRTFQHSSATLAVAFSPDGNRVLAGSNDHTLKLWELTTGQLLRTFEGHSSGVHSVAFSPEGARVISASWDTTVRLWSLQTGTWLATMIGTRDDEWIAMTPDGFFATSTKGADETLSAVRGFDVTNIGQIHQSLFNPDLLREGLAGDPVGEVREAAKVINLEKVVESGPAPVVAITSHPPGSQSREDLVTVEARIADKGKGIGRIEWRINSVTAAVATKPPGSGPDYNVSQQLALDPGDNVIELVAYNGSNLLASQPARTTITFTGTADAVKPKLHILAIGVDKYVDRGWTPPGSNARVMFGPLGLAVKDATTLAADIRHAATGLYADVRVELALDEQAARENLEATVDRFAKGVHPRDTVILFAAAHGYSVSGRFYLIPQDFQGGTNPEALAARAIGQDLLQDWLANRIKARKTIVLLDTCESGALIGGHTRARTEGGASEAAVGRLHEATGRPVLTAAATGQFAHEGVVGPSGTTHGIFTWALLDALRNGDRNGNGVIELSEIVAHVQAQVPGLAAKLKREGRAASVVATPEYGKQSARFGSRGEDFALVRRLQ